MNAILTLLQEHKVYFQSTKMASFKFKNTLDQLLRLGWPAMKALTCLEANGCNPGDVCLYWHAILAEMDSVIKDLTKDNDPDSFSSETAQQLYSILHQRNHELFGKKGRISTAKDLFYAGLYLDPGNVDLVFEFEASSNLSNTSLSSIRLRFVQNRSTFRTWYSGLLWHSPSGHFSGGLQLPLRRCR